MATKRKDPRVQYADMRNGYQQTWETSLLQAPCKQPCCCLTSAFCPPCVSYALRRRVLYNDLRSYLCCGGYCPCSGRMCESSCPWLCLALEVTLCYPQSVFVTRFMIQDEMQIHNTQCDNCLIGTVIVLQYISCILQCAACITGNDELEIVADAFSLFADLVYCSVCACMQAQHKSQLDERDRHPNIVLGTPFPPDLAPDLMPTFTGHPGAGHTQGVPVEGQGGAASQPTWSQPPPGYPTK